jgi:hypothetical protein
LVRILNIKTLNNKLLIYKIVAITLIFPKWINLLYIWNCSTNFPLWFVFAFYKQTILLN